MTDDLRQRARDLIKFQRQYGNVAIAQVVEELLRECDNDSLMERCRLYVDRSSFHVLHGVQREKLLRDIDHKLNRQPPAPEQSAAPEPSASP